MERDIVSQTLRPRAFSPARLHCSLGRHCVVPSFLATERCELNNFSSKTISLFLKMQNTEIVVCGSQLSFCVTRNKTIDDVDISACSNGHCGLPWALVSTRPSLSRQRPMMTQVAVRVATFVVDCGQHRSVPKASAKLSNALRPWTIMRSDLMMSLSLCLARNL